MKQGKLTQILNEHYLREDRLSFVSYPRVLTENGEALVDDIIHNYDCKFIDNTGSFYGKEYSRMTFKLNANTEQYILPSVEQAFEKTFKKYGFDVGRIKVYLDHSVQVDYKKHLDESLLRENTSNIKQLYKKSPCKATIMSNLKDDIWDRDDFVRKVCNALGKDNDLLKKIKNFMPDLTNNPSHFIKLFLKFSDENTCKHLVKKLGWSSYVKNLPSDLGFNESYLREGYTENKLIDEFIEECIYQFNELGIKRGETIDTELFVPVEQDSKQLWDKIHEQASNNGFGIRTMEKDLGDDENYYYLYITKTR